MEQTAPSDPHETLFRQKKLSRLLTLMDRCNSPEVFRKRTFRFKGGKTVYELPSYSCEGLADDHIRIGLFAGIHGDETAGSHALARFGQLVGENPALAQGYSLFLYPVCNPTGFEYATAASRRGKDLNQEFWRNSAEPEIAILEEEIRANKFHGIVSLHVNSDSPGIFGYASGATLTKDLLRPALEAASQYLPVNTRNIINGFPSHDGIVSRLHDGALAGPPGLRRRAFEITLEVPGQAPQYLQENVLLSALLVILTEYRKYISYAADL